MTRRTLLPPSVSSLALLALLSGCGETGPSIRLDPAAITNVTGVPLSGPAGDVLAERIIVMVLDALQNPLPGVTVTFAASGTGAAVSPASTVTNDQGEASTRWTLARTPGQQSLTVTAGGTTLQINATAGSPRIASLAVGAGNNQSGPTGTPLSTPPSVIARDANGAPVEGVTVSFTVLSGGGSVSAPTAVTNAQGVASVQWTLGPGSGAQLMSAQVPQSGVTGNPVMFTATGTAGAPASVLAISALQQSAQAGAVVSSTPSVIVRDVAGNPVANAQVVFAVTSGGGSLTSATQTTSALGVATVGTWRLGSTPGTNTVTATVAGVAPVTFTATGNAGTPTLLVKTAGDNQTASVNRPVAIPPQVRVQDAAGNGVVGMLVTFTVTSGDGSAVVNSVTTASDGRASVGAWILGSTPGSNTLVASVTGLQSVTFFATATSGAAVSMQPLSPQNQNGGPNLPAASPPSVVLRDALGNPVNGVTVTFTVTGGGGSVTGPSQLTNSLGVATVGSWTFGPIAGQNSVTASASGLANVVFTASTTGVPAALVIFDGNNQAAVAGFDVPVAPAVRVIDNTGNGVSGIIVNFQVTSGGGVLGVNAVQTDATGIASSGGWTLGSALNQSVQASIPHAVVGNPAVFTAISATNMVITQQPPTNVASGTPFSLTVELRNVGGALAPVDGHPMTVAIQTGAGVLGGTLTVNTAGGSATFSNLTITGVNGARTLRITGAGLGQVITTTINVP